MTLRRSILLPALLVFSLSAMANPSNWKIVPDTSSIKFTATQNGAPVTGEFKTFSGAIVFDPAQLDKSNINVTVDIASVSTTYKEVSDTLKTADWFDAKVFPQAIFKADKFTKMNDKTYQAIGTLTIRDKTVPVTLTFTLPEYMKDKAQAVGETTVNRTDFGLGKGDWAKTDDVKDAVKIDFILSAIPG